VRSGEAGGEGVCSECGEDSGGINKRKKRAKEKSTFLSAMNKRSAGLSLLCVCCAVMLIGNSRAPLASDGKATKGMTSSVAAETAYQSAVKWREDAVLWFLQPDVRSYSLGHDTSSYWVTLFASRQDNKLFRVLVRNDSPPWGKEEQRRTRASEIKEFFPLSKPKTPLDKAVKSCLSAVGIRQIGTVSPLYTIDSGDKPFAGTPTWSLLVSGRTPDRQSVKKFCTVDSQTGKVVSIADKSANFW